MNKYGGVTISDVLRVIFGPFVLIFAFTLLAFLALCEEIHSWFGGKRTEDWMADRERYYDTSEVKKVDWPLERQKALGNECRYCGYNYQDPKYCSVWGRTADEHEWI